MRAATPRHGRQRSAIRSSRAASGRDLKPERELRRLLQGEIAGGKSVRMAEAEQEKDIGRPRAHALDRDERRMGVLGVEPRQARQIELARSATASASARKVRIFGDERPQARKSSSVAAASRTASSGAMRASSRPKMALALATDTCCETTIAARPAKPGSRRRSGGGPPTAISVSTKSGSFCAQASRRLAQARLVRDRRPGMIDPFRGPALRPPCAGALRMHPFFSHALQRPLGISRPAFRSVAERRFCTSVTPIRRFATSASPKRLNGRLLLRIEDLDRTRCKPHLRGGDSRGSRLARPSLRRRRRAGKANTRTTTPLRSTRLAGRGLVYPCFCSRAEIARALSRPRSGRSAALFGRLPGAFARAPSRGGRRGARSAALRLDMRRASECAPVGLVWTEFGEGTTPVERAAEPDALGRRRPARARPRGELPSRGDRRRRAAGRHRRRARARPSRRDLRPSAAAGAARAARAALSPSSARARLRRGETVEEPSVAVAGRAARKRRLRRQRSARRSDSAAGDRGGLGVVLS